MGARCHTCQGTGHSKEQCTVSKDKLYCKNCKKKGLHNTNNYCRRQLDKAKKNKNEKKDERSNSTERKKTNTAKKSSDRDPTPVRTTEDDDLGDSGNRTCLLNPESEDEEELEDDFTEILNIIERSQQDDVDDSDMDKVTSYDNDR